MKPTAPSPAPSSAQTGDPEDRSEQPRRLGSFAVTLLEKGKPGFNTLRVGPRWSFSK